MDVEPLQAGDDEVEQPATAEKPRRTERPDRRAGRARLVFALALVIASVGFASWYGWQWWRAETAAARLSEIRDEVLRMGEQGVAVLNTLDHAKIDEGMDRWLESSTGQLHDALAGSRAESKKRLEAARSSTSAKVVDAAVTDLDEVRGAATVIASAEITVTSEGGQPAVRSRRFQADLTRTDIGWKLTALVMVQVGAS